jgi:WD40 repeat protein/serine/threonine protein kinase
MEEETQGVRANDLDDIEKAVNSFLERRRRGERPLISEYLRRFPDRASDVRELLGALEAVEDLGAQPRAPLPESEGGSPAPPAGRLEKLGEYRILREIGRGGMGVVYEAEQASLGRHVALKVLPFPTRSSRQRLERFLREARAGANLQHKNIVPVYAVGEDAGCHYFVMQLIRGHALDDVLGEVRKLHRQRGLARGEGQAGSSDSSCRTAARTLISSRIDSLIDPVPGHPVAGEDAGRGQDQRGKPRSSSVPLSEAGDLAASALEQQYFYNIAQIGLQVAEALDYANEQGVLHRDIKPSNLLLDVYGNVWVTDFGLAKVTGSESLTDTGDVFGTVPYMAPERFSGWSDPRSDIYSLGMTLYEMATLEPAFSDSDRARLVQSVLEVEPVSPRKREPRVPRDLEKVILKAVDKESGRRYASARELADDLRRFLAGEPVLARRSSGLERTLKWAKRRKALAALILVSVTALLVITVGSLTYSHQIEARRYTGRRHLYQAQMKLAQLAFDDHNLRQAVELLQKQDPTPEDPDDLRAFEWHHFWERCHASSHVWAPHEGDVYSVVYSPDGSLLATGGPESALKLWDSRSLEPREIGELGEGVAAGCFFPDGARFLASGADRVPVVWDLATRKAVRRLEGNSNPIKSLAVSPDGALAAAGTSGERYFDPVGELLLWDVDPGVVRWRLPFKTAVTAVDFSRDGRLVANGFWGDKQVSLCSVETGKVLRTFPISGPGIWALKFTPDGRRLCASVMEAPMVLWEVASGEVVRTFQPPERTQYVAISPDGQRLAAGGSDLVLFDLESGSEERRFRGFAGSIFSAAFTPGRETLLTGGNDGTLELWDVNATQGPAVLKCAGENIDGLALSPDGKLLAVGLLNGGRLEVRSTTDAQLGSVVENAHPGGVASVAFSPLSGRLVSGGREDVVLKVWEVSSQNAQAALLQELPFENLGPDSWVRLWITPDGTLAATGSRQDGTRSVGVWRERRGGFELIGEQPWKAAHLAASPQGDVWALTTAEGALGFATAAELTSAGAPEPSFQSAHLGEIRNLAFSPDGTLLATAGFDRLVKVWNVQERGLVQTLRHSSQVWSVAFSPDGGRLVTGALDGITRVWDTEDWLEVVSLRGHGGAVSQLRFDAEGVRLFSAGGYDGTVRIWRGERVW